MTVSILRTLQCNNSPKTISRTTRPCRWRRLCRYPPQGCTSPVPVPWGMAPRPPPRARPRADARSDQSEGGVLGWGVFGAPVPPHTNGAEACRSTPKLFLGPVVPEGGGAEPPCKYPPRHLELPSGKWGGLGITPTLLGTTPTLLGIAPTLLGIAPTLLGIAPTSVWLLGISPGHSGSPFW